MKIIVKCLLTECPLRVSQESCTIMTAMYQMLTMCDAHVTPNTVKCSYFFLKAIL